MSSTTVSLSGASVSARDARRVLRRVLTEAGRTEWLEASELACTEVVTNAVLHAHTDIEVTIAVHPDHVRVEVRDNNPALPSQRAYNEQATTGRGMALVAALTAEHGVSDADATGKTVWFVVRSTAQEQGEDELLAAWAGADWDLTDLTDPVADTSGEATRTVVLLGLPPTLWLAARQHHDTLIRELVLYLAEHDDLDVDVTATDRARTVIARAVTAGVEEAHRTGAARRVLPAGHPSPLEDAPATLDLELHIAADLAPGFAAMQDTLDAAERLATAGQMLVRPGLPEIVAVRDWACEQVTAQLAGVAPSPWPGADQERFTVMVHERDREPALSTADVAAVRHSDKGVVAADEANRIVAVSRRLAALVGWDADELVGRRIVTLIPPRLREAHVAGFTRHLTTGEAHVLDVPLTLPVLHKDGSEILCDFLVQVAPASGDRPIYLAWIDAAT